MIDGNYRLWHSYPSFGFIESTVVAIGQANSQMSEFLQNPLKDGGIGVRWRAAGALGKIGSLEILEKLIQRPEIDIYDTNIFSLARKLAVLYSKERVPFLPVYPGMVSMGQILLKACGTVRTRPLII